MQSLDFRLAEKLFGDECELWLNSSISQGATVRHGPMSLAANSERAKILLKYLTLRRLSNCLMMRVARRVSNQTVPSDGPFRSPEQATFNMETTVVGYHAGRKQASVMFKLAAATSSIARSVVDGYKGPKYEPSVEYRQRKGFQDA